MSIGKNDITANFIISFENLQIKLQVAWFDQRLLYYDLKHDENLNSITQNQKNRMWMPEIVFQNTKDMFEAEFKSSEALAIVSTTKSTTFNRVYYTFEKGSPH